MSLLVFSTNQLLSFYHCPELFIKLEESREGQALDEKSLTSYMEEVRKWALSGLGSDESKFLGGDDEESQVALYSTSLGVYVNLFAVRTTPENPEPIFFLRTLPKTIRDNHLLVFIVALQALRDIGYPTASRAWLTTGQEHLPVTVPEENFERVKRACADLRAGTYQVKTGGKCRFCPIKDSCEVYDNVSQIISLCQQGPAWFAF